MTKHPCAWSLRNVARFSAGVGMSEALSRVGLSALCRGRGGRILRRRLHGGRRGREDLLRRTLSRRIDALAIDHFFYDFRLASGREYAAVPPDSVERTPAT